MLNPERLAAYFSDALPPAERAEVEIQIADDPALQRVAASQQLMDQALRAALGGRAADERVKQSVLAVVRAAPIQQLRARVLTEIAPETRAGVAACGWRAIWRTFRAHAASWAGSEFTLARRLAMGTALLAVGLGVYLVYRSPQPATQNEIGQFTVVIGGPTLRHPGERTASEARRNTPVQLGDHLETSDAGRAEIQFRDGTTLRLHFNTAFESSI